MLKNFAIGDQLRIIRLYHSIELVDADQCVFIGRVTMQELVLDQTGQLPEFGNVSPQEIDTMHRSKNAAHFSLP